MTDYNPPLKDMLFTIHELSGVKDVLKLPAYSDVDLDIVNQVVEEAGKFAADVLAPQNAVGDLQGCRVENRAVVPPEVFADLYAQFAENGWQSLPHDPEYGGMGLPEIAAAAAAETWQAANLSFSLCPLLTAGAITAIGQHANDEIKQTYLPRMITGEWAGTMNLTEPQAGSDLAAVATRARPEGDHYRISGTKIFITWGDNPFSTNIIHLVLARLSDAPEGVRGLSLFLVPKFLVNEDGSLGEHNDVYAVSVEHKLGIHGSPTCVMEFGADEGAVGYLVGEPNKGLACMFTMMNHARIEVGIQGLGISERSYQLARRHALERVQGHAPGVKGRATIIHHADVRRMLLVMKSQIEAMRAVAYVTAGYDDLAQHAEDKAEREAADRRMALLTPVVKGWATEIAQEIVSLGVQVHGGMGFVEETGAAQLMRDARILTIYEGTTGIQAGDFIGRKILGDEGREMQSLIAEMKSLDGALADAEGLSTIRASLAQGIDELETAVTHVVGHAANDPHCPGAASFNLLMLAGVVIGGYQMARAALAASSGDGFAAEDAAFRDAKCVTSRFYAEHILPRATAYARAVTAGSSSTMDLAAESF